MTRSLIQAAWLTAAVQTVAGILFGPAPELVAAICISVVAMEWLLANGDNEFLAVDDQDRTLP